MLAKTFDPNQPRDDHGRWSSTGAGADHSKDNLDEDQRAFVAKYGDNFTSALNHLYDNWGISGDAALALQAEIHAKTPEQLVDFVESDGYVGQFEDDGGEEVAKEWLRDNSEFDALPEIVRRHLDLDGLGYDLVAKEGPLMSFWDYNAGEYHVFKRPKKG